MRFSKHSAATGLLSLCLLAGPGGACMAADASGAAVDAGSITIPTDEATLAEFVGKLKAAYIDRPSGLVSTELGSITYTGRAQSLQGEGYCRGWVAAVYKGKCGDNQPTLRCEPGSLNGEKGIACYNLGAIKNSNLLFVTKIYMSRSTKPVYVDFLTYADFQSMLDRYKADPTSDPAQSAPPADIGDLLPSPADPDTSGPSQSGDGNGGTEDAGVKVRSDWGCFTPTSRLEEIDVKFNGLRLNNFSLSEEDSMFGTHELSFSYSATNRNAQVTHIDVQLAAFDEDDRLIFVVRGAPMMGIVSSNSTDTATGTTFVPKGSLADVRKLCLATHPE